MPPSSAKANELKVPGLSVLVAVALEPSFASALASLPDPDEVAVAVESSAADERESPLVFAVAVALEESSACAFASLLSVAVAFAVALSAATERALLSPVALAVAFPGVVLTFAEQSLPSLVSVMRPLVDLHVAPPANVGTAPSANHTDTAPNKTKVSRLIIPDLPFLTPISAPSPS